MMGQVATAAIWSCVVCFAGPHSDERWVSCKGLMQSLGIGHQKVARVCKTIFGKADEGRGKQTSHVAHESDVQLAHIDGARRCNVMAGTVEDQDDGVSLVLSEHEVHAGLRLREVVKTCS